MTPGDCILVPFSHPLIWTIKNFWGIQSNLSRSTKPGSQGPERLLVVAAEVARSSSLNGAAHMHHCQWHDETSYHLTKPAAFAAHHEGFSARKLIGFYEATLGIDACLVCHVPHWTYLKLRVDIEEDSITFVPSTHWYFSRRPDLSHDMIVPPHLDPVHTLYNGRFTITPPFQIDNLSPFSLNMSGVTGFLRGDDAVSAITAIHVYGNRRWLGWHNTPGSFQIAKRLSSFAKSASFSGISSRNLSLSESVRLDPTTLFEPDSSNYKGLRFRAAHSGTVIGETGYLAALFMKECTAFDSEDRVVPGRRTQPVRITIVNLRVGQAPTSEMRPARSSVFTLLAASVPIATSIGTCTLCAVSQDWYASSLILIGIVASGVSCLVLGSADLVFTHPEPAKESPAADGILGSKNDIVLLKGTEGAVNSITRGRFSLHFSSEAHYNFIQCCSLLFYIQCITQLLLIPQASLFGQVMFLTSLGVSALYNAWLSSLDKERVHRRLLFERVLANPTFTKYTLGTRTTAVVFMLLVLQPQDPTKLLDELLPNDTKVWKQWKGVMLEQLRHLSDHSFLSEGKLGDVNGFAQQEQGLLNLLYEDAHAAYNGYKDYLEVESS